MQTVSVKYFALLCIHLCLFLTACLALALTLGLGEDFQKLYIRKVSRIMILLKCISIMIHFGKCIKYQYLDTILNQVSVSVSRYSLPVSYPTLHMGTAIKHPVSDQVKPSCVLFLTSRHWRLIARMSQFKNPASNLVWHRVLYRCTRMATVGVEGLR